MSSGWITTYAGRYSEGIADFEHAYRINPLHPNLGHCRSGHGLCLFGLKDYEGAVSLLEKALADDPGFGTTEQCLGAAYELAGRPIEAQRVIARYVKTYPSNTIAYYLRTTPFRDEDFRMRMAAGLRTAGVPEG